MAEKNVHKVYGSFPPWGKSVKPANGGGGNYVYYSGANGCEEFVLFASIIKANIDSEIVFFPTGLFMSMYGVDGFVEGLISAGFDLSMKITIPGSSELVTVGDFIANVSKKWTQITEEEFYRDPNALEDGYFRVSSDYENTDVILQYDDGMTWRDWINSHYNLNPTTSKPYLSIGYDKIVHWKYSDGYYGSMHNEYESDSSIEIDDLITNKTYYAVIIA